MTAINEDDWKKYTYGEGGYVMCVQQSVSPDGGVVGELYKILEVDEYWMNSYGLALMLEGVRGTVRAYRFRPVSVRD